MSNARSRGGRNRSRRKRAERDFWAYSYSDDTDEEPLIRRATEPGALIKSLGPPPLPGNAANVAEHYFAVVYERAAGLAVALAAAADMLDLDEDEEEDDAPFAH